MRVLQRLLLVAIVETLALGGVARCGNQLMADVLAMPGTPEFQSTQLMRVAGIYDIFRTTESGTCEGNPAGTRTKDFGIVIHAPGGAAFVVEDIAPKKGPRLLYGSLRADGTFGFDPPKSGSAAGTSTFENGRFTSTGFEITEKTGGTGAGGECHEVIRWQATKRDTTNTIGTVLAESPASTSSPQLQVSGAYDVRKTGISDTCASASTKPASFSNPVAIAQESGLAKFVLNDHGTRSLGGQVKLDGTFTMETQRGMVMDRIHASDTFSAGRFTAKGFEVLVTTDLDANPNPGGGGACRMVMRWEGVKLGRPNVLPGLRQGSSGK